jgi:hypothetical protein
MRVPDPAEGFIVRLDEVVALLAALAEAPIQAALTEPDQPTGERWEAGQVWAHMVEFVPYWMDQIRAVLENDTSEPPPFGRVKTDPDRIAAIEAGRRQPPAAQYEQLTEEVGDLKAFLADLAEEDWLRAGLHQSKGAMPMDRIMEEFLVGHLEEHAAQLQSISGRSSPPSPPTR